MPMRRLLVLPLAALLALAFLAPAQARPALGQQAASYRSDAVALLRDYEARLAPRLPAADRARVHTLIGDADRELAVLSRALARLDSARPAQRAARKAAAIRAFDAARASADAALAEIQPLAVRTLGFGELLAAKGDADAMLARFDRLGQALRSA